jgi:RHS repeat-associated protein
MGHRDWVGSRRAITNAAGTVTDLRQSLPFGDGAANVSGSRDNTFDGFAGYWGGGSTATNHAPFREYWNVAGRWLQPDPYYGSYDATNPQNFNRFVYVLDNPVNLIDPTGLDCIQNVPTLIDPDTGSPLKVQPQPLDPLCSEWIGGINGPTIVQRGGVRRAAAPNNSKKYRCPLFGPCYKGPALPLSCLVASCDK